MADDSQQTELQNAQKEESSPQVATLGLSTEDLMKAAQEEVEKAMANAMADLPPVTKAEDQEVIYVEPIQDPYSRAIKYLEKHDILQLFQHLTASIVYTKPEQPLEYMMQEVERIKKQKEKAKEKAKKT